MGRGYAYRWENPDDPVLKVPDHLSKTPRPPVFTIPKPILDGAAPDPTLPRVPRLPVPVVSKVLLSLDLDTINKSIKLLNSHFYCFVERLFEYRKLKTHAYSTLQIMRVTGAAQHITLFDLFNEFMFPFCHHCLDFAPYLFLPLFQRICLNCLKRRRPDCDLDLIFNAAANYGLSEDDLERNVPILRPPHCLYRVGKEEMYTTGDEKLTLLMDAEELGIKRFGNLQTMLDHAHESRSTGLARYKAALAEWEKGGRLAFEKPGIPPFLTVTPYDDEGKSTEGWEFAATAVFPYWNPHTNRSQTGVHCSGCTNAFEGVTVGLDDWIDAMHRVYMWDEISSHLSRCEWRKFVNYQFGQRMGHAADPNTNPDIKKGLDFEVGFEGEDTDVEAELDDDMDAGVDFDTVLDEFAR
ncbi:hypothetical protein AJ80_08218 [Polytolypa hystricis UAMH7299]|uniref:F-box domain-containing protein n=1 Tax=Polytolypa hystricis (strain UAMH7299) TaxID=1447883 RepID=A0A2B7XBK3_POLH7|nr:hypothetical protein AJ80_08218 [Polytolypa hystricis UAMH7299]